ncbi:SMP-30/gluconolactonase/LRE family protein [Maridesulfovibrio sp.]|uniref:SMP-30/gluconolactonase/LRE family protein n=1 Tax=Maridesulfovibrio sp. TaxID=2795000 RepID=UPI0039F09D30
MRKYSIIAICLFMLLQLAACSQKTIVVEGFSSPESVTSDGHYFYVSNVGEKLQPTLKDGDGFISRLSSDGEVLERKFIKGLNAPKGMVVTGGVLYVADIDRVKGFELKTGSKVFDLFVEGTSFLNDIVVLSADELLVSATDTGALYMIKTGSSPQLSKVDVVGEIYGTNGLCFDPQSRTVYFASFGRDHKPTGFIGKGSFKDGKFISEKVYSKKGLYDGIAFYNGTLLFSDWVAAEKKGIIIQKNLETNETVEIDLGEKIGGPADFYLDSKGKRLWIPMMMENKIMIAGY